MFFRSATMRAVKPTLVRRGRAPEDLFTAMELVGRITDSVLVGLASAYEGTPPPQPSLAEGPSFPRRRE